MIRNLHWLGIAAIAATAGCPVLSLIAQQQTANSASTTPATAVYVPDVGIGGNHIALAISGTHSATMRGASVAMVELRGWLVAMPPSPPAPSPPTPAATGCNPDHSDHDIHWELEVDPLWADQIGLKLSELYRPGHAFGYDQPATVTPGGTRDPSGTGVGRGRVMTPTVHVELNDWSTSQNSLTGHTPPADWSYRPSDPNCNGTLFPYDFHRPQPALPILNFGDYVRMVGSLVTDDPHLPESIACQFAFEGDMPPPPPWYQRTTGDTCGSPEARATTTWRALWQCDHLNPVPWSCGDSHDPRGASRWPELHPPDTIAFLGNTTPRTRTVRLVSLIAMHGLTPPDCRSLCVDQAEAETLDADIAPPPLAPQLRQGKTVHVSEEVGSATNCATIVEGNGCAARITVASDHVHVHVKVAGQGNYGVSGKYFSIIRVWWE
jgi:hypothetical protein